MGALAAPTGMQSGLKLLAREQKDFFVATFGIQPNGFKLGKGRFDQVAVVADLDGEYAARLEMGLGASQMRRTMSSPSSPAASASAGSWRYSGGRASMDSVVT